MALADALVTLAEDEPRRVALGAAARQLAIDRYSWHDIAGRLLQMYREVTGLEQAAPRAAA